MRTRAGVGFALWRQRNQWNNFHFGGGQADQVTSVLAQLFLKNGWKLEICWRHDLWDGGRMDAQVMAGEFVWPLFHMCWYCCPYETSWSSGRKQRHWLLLLGIYWIYPAGRNRAENGIFHDGKKFGKVQPIPEFFIGRTSWAVWMKFCVDVGRCVEHLQWNFHDDPLVNCWVIELKLTCTDSDRFDLKLPEFLPEERVELFEWNFVRMLVSMLSIYSEICMTIRWLVVELLN